MIKYQIVLPAFSCPNNSAWHTATNKATMKNFMLKIEKNAKIYIYI